MKQIGPRIPMELYKKLAIICIEENVSINQKIIELIKQEIEMVDEERESGTREDYLKELEEMRKPSQKQEPKKKTPQWIAPWEE